MSQSRQSAIFGKRKEPHTVIIARGDQIHHFTVRPWIAAAIGSACAAVAIGYLLATTYLVLRDDLIGATVARQARMQQAYEDRISALRSQVDRITSRQLLDQQMMEEKVGELISRQQELAERQARIGPLLDGGEALKSLSDEAVPIPSSRPDVRAGLDAGTSTTIAGLFPDLRPAIGNLSAADNADRLFVSINQSLRSIETDQVERLKAMTEKAYRTAGAISDALEDAGLTVAKDYGTISVGGPLLPVDTEMQFEAVVDELDEALTALDAVKAKARKLPISNPAPGKQVSSGFGVRKDPLLGTPALHAGMDFRAATGSSVRSSGAGTVVAAGWNGGYGRMVEVDHGKGLTTRYAHMSKILVSVGDKVEPGDVVGRVGTTGRSTGPHLHYEVRRDGKPLNPLTFIKAGKAIAGLI
ncbi:MAG: peptidoglycan DD-metalloendopeptidase family protein [Mesorhizobium sp.]|nr:peptidoglycan DD-metalloendopeptidase family protein [Mesorhizobium sp.]MCO5163414.1 peptidoglycan DD-metalloendopeptidase family protein [Mesorhizobium sp.]